MSCMGLYRGDHAAQRQMTTQIPIGWYLLVYGICLAHGVHREHESFHSPEDDKDADSDEVTSSPFPSFDISRNTVSRLVRCFTSTTVSTAGQQIWKEENMISCTVTAWLLMQHSHFSGLTEIQDFSRFFFSKYPAIFLRNSRKYPGFVGTL